MYANTKNLNVLCPFCLLTYPPVPSHQAIFEFFKPAASTVEGKVSGGLSYTYLSVALLYSD